MHVQVEQFTQGKDEHKNEDTFSFNETSFILSDGATDKSGNVYDGKTGGEILSHFLAQEALNVDKNGVELIRYLTEKIQYLYAKINPDALTDAKKRFNATFICVRITGEHIIITLVGDSICRINGEKIFSSPSLIDEINSATRKHYIETTGDIDGAGDFIFPMLRSQINYQISAESPVGYGTLDGTHVPEKYIHIIKLPLHSVRTIELVSDGYMELPNEVNIEAYEKLYQYINEVDPYKYKDYPAVKCNDDRTVAILQFDK